MSPRKASKLRFARFGVMSLVAVAAVVGWAQIGPLLRDSLAASVPATAGETFALLRECHKRRAYGAMRPYIHPSGREAVIDLLISVDELSMANSAVLAAIERACPAIEIDRYNLASVIQSRLELFSNEVDLVEVQEEGDRATVTVEVSGRLPLERLAFERNGGLWQYQPGPENPEILRTIRGLTRTFNQIELALGSGEWTADRIDREFQIRIRPKLRLMRQQVVPPVIAASQAAEPS